MDSRDSGNLALLGRHDLGMTFTKLHCWKLTQFDKCVFLDADAMVSSTVQVRSCSLLTVLNAHHPCDQVLKNCDELFEREEFSAAPDPGWPDCFNSGVFVYRPSLETYSKLVEFANTQGSFDGKLISN